MREQISACITACDEEQNIRRCLESVKWCDEIVVVDSLSADRTVEICREYTDRVYQHEWRGYIGQKNLIRSLARYPWVLFVDADEEVSPELRDEILAQFAAGTGPYVGFQFPRMVYYLGRWIRHGEWYPDIKLRLFRKELGHSEGQEPHDRVAVKGPVKTLKAPLHHFTYGGIWEHLETMNRYSTITAREKHRLGEPFRWRDLFFRPAWRFLKSYFLKGGMLDGPPGLVIALITTFGVYMKYSKLWELQHKNGASTIRKDGPA
ncbi:MAG: glycosyltransferase family 2 protein [Verrucomicrobia bacterium]|nr:glycosyltransferase family 2 protein [Verrucomicrobiota bacterium]